MAAEKAAAGGLVVGDERLSLHDLLDFAAEGEDRTLIQAMDEPTRLARRRALLAALLGRLARKRPLLAAVEDLHWGDPVLLEDLAALGAATVQSPLLLVLSTRPEGDPLDRAWRSRLGPAAVSTIDLAPLSADESAALAAGYLESGDQRIAACIERAEGNPFFLEQLLRHTGEVASAACRPRCRASSWAGPTGFSGTEARSPGGLGAGPAHAAGGVEAPDRRSGLRRRTADRSAVHAPGGKRARLRPCADAGRRLWLASKSRRRELHRAAAGWYGERDLPLKARHLDIADAPGAAEAYLAAAE